MSFDFSKLGMTLPKSWSLIRIGDIASINNRTIKKNDEPDDIYYIDISSVTTGEMSRPTYMKYGGAPSRAKRRLVDGDIIISCVRPNLKQHILIEKVGTDWVASTGFCVISCNEILYRWYLYAFLTSNIFNEYLVRVADGGVYPAFNPREIEEALIPWPTKQEIKIIDSFVKSMSNKIALNGQINQTLESMAQAIFKSWFVDFAPVKAKIAALESGEDAEGVTRAAMRAISGKTDDELDQMQGGQPENYAKLKTTAELFPDAMQDSELGEVPEGWEIKQIQDLAKIIKGKSYTSAELAESKNALVTLKSFNRGGGYRLDGLKEYTGSYKAEQEVFAGDLIIAYTDVTQAADVIGKPAMVVSDSRYEHLAISLDLAVVRPKIDCHKYFLYGLAMTETFQNYTKSYTTGTTVLHLGKSAVPEFKFPKPSEELLKLYEQNASPMFKLVNENIEDGRNMENLRDILLPKLLSGELSIDALKIKNEYK